MPFDALMLQGTGSGVGKSLLTAAFCRVLREEGLSVAPFKAQNMSLNSYVTAQGEEVARSIVTQAQACGLDVDVRMNPVLLKPSRDNLSQCLLLGKPYTDWNSKEFMKSRDYIRSVIHEAYTSLRADYDVIVLEGAGSPGEVNLRKHDLVNMNMARHANAAVMLVGDIDRGGLFASYIGHLHIMEDWERDLVIGFLINKFRGDVSLLDDAIKITKDYTGKDTLGILPFQYGLELPEEDGMIYNREAKPEAPIRLGVVAYPYLSNFTDFDAFYTEADVNITFIREALDLSSFDAVFLPGSKNVPHDLNWIEQVGIKGRLLDYSRDGGELIGICGGKQILGTSVYDGTGIENKTTTPMTGLGLLDITTEYYDDKTLKRVFVTHNESSLPVHGYEIHHGRTEIKSGVALFNGAPELGIRHEKKPVWATYLHGIFDADEYRHWFLEKIRKSKGLPSRPKVKYDLEPSLDTIAGLVREHCDIKTILGRLNL